jgi:hypothetical protein
LALLVLAPRVSYAACEPTTLAYCYDARECDGRCLDHCCIQEPGGGDIPSWTCFPAGADGKLHYHLR